jgi:hypothetical protein
MGLSKQQQQQIIWRRNQVLDLLAKGYNQSHIARALQVDTSVICRDVFYLSQQSKENIRKHFEERLPVEVDKCLAGLTAILRESWHIANENDVERREKIQALSLAKECYTTKLELLTNVNVLKDAMHLVTTSHQSQQNQTQQQTNNSNQSEKVEETSTFDNANENEEERRTTIDEVF